MAGFLEVKESTRELMEELDEVEVDSLPRSLPKTGKGLHLIKRAAFAAVFLGLVALAFVALPSPSNDGISSSFHGLSSTRRHSLETSLVGFAQQQDIDNVNCALDVGQAVLRLMGALLLAQASPNACSDTETQTGKARCSNNVNGVIYNFILLMGMIASAVSHCADSVNAPASCTGTIAGFLGNIGVIAGCASGAAIKCDLWWRNHRVSPWGVTTTKAPFLKRGKLSRDLLDGDKAAEEEEEEHEGRRLDLHFPDPTKFSSVPHALPTLVPQELYQSQNTNKRSYQVNMANCFVNVAQGAAFLGRAAITIMDSVKWCPPEKQVQHKGRQICTTDVFSLFAALGLASRFLSLGVASCNGYFVEGDDAIAGARCAADIIGVAAGTFAATAPAINLQKVCSQAGEKAIEGKDPANVLPEIVGD